MARSHGSRLLVGAGMLAHAGAVRCWWSVRSVLVLIFVDGYIWAVGLVFACLFLLLT
ncbi:hypothetical protein [Moraxella bovoculi]|uniref:hypothetical protein n=1 Tax=Moraxella bovoculi TaxID=386891 RepID=UPI000B1F98A0|nr:hypothetical protein [Moraxella bovoculi]